METISISQAVKTAKIFAHKRSALPALSCIKFNGNMEATDMEASIRISGPDIRQAETGYYPAAALEIALKVGAAMPAGLPVEGFPLLPQFDGAAPGFTIRAEDFISGVQRVIPAASKDETRPVLCGVLLTGDKDGFTLAATDSYRLHTLEVRPSSGFTASDTFGQVEAIIPATSLAKLVRAYKSLPKKQRPDTLAAAFPDEQVHFSFFGPARNNQGIQIFTRQIIGQFPNYKQLLPHDDDIQSEAVFARDELAGALKRCWQVAKTMPQKDHPLTLECSGQSYSVRVAAGEHRHSGFDASGPLALEVALTPAETTGGTVAPIGLAPAYILDAVTCAAGESVTVKRTSPLKPVLVESPGYKALTMPVRLSA